MRRKRVDKGVSNGSAVNDVHCLWKFSGVLSLDRVSFSALLSAHINRTRHPRHTLEAEHTAEAAQLLYKTNFIPKYIFANEF